MNTTGALGEVTGTGRGRALTIALWVAQALLAIQFAAGGLLKLVGTPEMVAMFAAIGVGQWLRYLVGALELAGAAGLLLPRRAADAALGLAGLMAGAALTNALVLGTTPAAPLVLLTVGALIAWGWRRRSGLPAVRGGR